MTARWGDHFTQVGASARGIGSKTTKADVMVWKGYFEGHPLASSRLSGSLEATLLISWSIPVHESVRTTGTCSAAITWTSVF